MAERVDRTLFAGAGYPVHPEILNSFNDSNRLKGFMPAGNALAADGVSRRLADASGLRRRTRNRRRCMRHDSQSVVQGNDTAGRHRSRSGATN